MIPIRRIAILGAGAMGTVLATHFLQVSEFETSVIARGERAERLRRTGLNVNRRIQPIPVTDPDTATDPVDLIVVAVKHHHLAEALRDLDPLVGPDTLFISVLNGLDSEAIIGDRYGGDKVLLCISVGIDALREGGAVTFTKAGKLYLGEARNDRLSDRVRRVQVALERAGLAYETPPGMVRMLWWKFMINVGVNQASAVTRAPYALFQTSADARALMFGLMREVITLAGCAGVNLREDDLTAWDGFLQTLSPRGKTSMLQDIDAGRKTEVEIFAGKVVELGQTYGIPSPMNETVLHIIRVLEATGP